MSEPAVIVKVSDVANIIRGVTYSKKDSSDTSSENSLPIFRANNIQNQTLNLSNLVYVNKKLVSEIQKVKKHDVVIAMSSGSKSLVGKAAQSNLDYGMAFGAFCGVLRPIEIVDPRYVGWFFNSAEYRNRVSELSAGANINNLKPSHFSEIDFPLAPLAEQKQIAQKLDELLAQVDTLKTRLDAIPKILKRFRQSVLAAAVSGRLTEEWREENGAKEHQEVTIDDVCEHSFYGPRFSKGDYVVSGGIPTIRTTDMDGRGGIKITDKTPRINVPEEKIDQFIARKDDLLVTRTGSIGVMAVFQGDYLAIPSAYLIRFRFSKSVLVKYIFSFLMSPVGQREMGLGTTAITQPNINAQTIRSIKFSLPSLQEQAEIVRRVEQLFAYADQIEQRVKGAQARVNHLTQSILAKAFRGELTADWRAQNPDLISGENSAVALLERIKTEREVPVKPKKKVRA